MRRFEKICFIALFVTTSPFSVGGLIYLTIGFNPFAGFLFNWIMFIGFVLFQIGICDMVFNN